MATKSALMDELLKTKNSKREQAATYERLLDAAHEKNVHAEDLAKQKVIEAAQAQEQRIHLLHHLADVEGERAKLVEEKEQLIRSNRDLKRALEEKTHESKARAGTIEALRKRVKTFEDEVAENIVVNFHVSGAKE